QSGQCRRGSQSIASSPSFRSVSCSQVVVDVIGTWCPLWLQRAAMGAPGWRREPPGPRNEAPTSINSAQRVGILSRSHRYYVPHVEFVEKFQQVPAAPEGPLFVAGAPWPAAPPGPAVPGVKAF